MYHIKMPSSLLSLAVLCLCLLTRQSNARFHIETAGLRIVLPTEASKQYDKGFETSLGNFGSPVYGGQLIGKLVYPDSSYGYDVDIRCSPPCNYACQPFNVRLGALMRVMHGHTISPPQESTPKFDLRSDKDKTYILLADRGPNNIAGVTACKFAEKTWNAQQAGAKGIIVVNYEDRQTTMYAPEDDEASYKWLKNITIPAVFVTKSTGDVLKGLMRDKKEVYVSLDWNDALPRKKTVEWEFWTNANDMCGAICDVQQEFIRQFLPVAQDLEQNNWTRFTPHYKIWRCPDAYKESDECRKQCIHKGRYCSPDPESDRFDGKDVVQENLRQLCVYKLANASGQSWVWWDYVTRFADQCNMEDGKYGKDCAEQVFKDIGGEKFSSMEKFRECTGDPQADTDNAMLEAEYASQVGSDSVGEVYILPTIRINNAQYRGKLAYYEVMRALCTGFSKDEEPQACLKVQENECLVGAPGDLECKKNTATGKTRCVDTFTGYKCYCGEGFYAHTNDKGEEECLDVNECWSAGTSLGTNCTCERCACKNVWGGYECIENIVDKCTADQGYGSCWHKEYHVNGQNRMFTNCKDNIRAFKTAAARGDDVANFPVYTCGLCPPCFVHDGDGCKPACTLDTCDLESGQCSGGGSAGVSGWTVALIVVAAVVVVAAGAYFVYWFRLRHAMHQEIRAIMAQYMPLESTDAPPPAPGAQGATELVKTPNGL